MNPATILTIPTRGTVSRWHANPCHALRVSGDTIDAHQTRCVVLLRELHPRADNHLVEVVRTHDEPERILGDMPAPVKLDFPEIARAYAQAEAEIRRANGLPWVRAYTDDRRWLKLVDRLDAWTWARDHAPEVLSQPDFVVMRQDVLAHAMTLRVFPAVEGIMGEMV